MDYLPHKDADLAAWTANFDAQLVAMGTTVGLDLAQVTAFSALNATWQAAYTTAVSGPTRGPSATAAKNTARTAVKANARELAAIIRAFPGLTDQQRVDLGLTVPDPTPSPVPVIVTAPNIEIEWVRNRSLRLRLSDADMPENKGKPEGVTGATIFMYVGDTPPADLSGWTPAADVTRVFVDLTIDPAVPVGAKIWFTAKWLNTKFQPSNLTSPVSTIIGEGVSEAA